MISAVQGMAAAVGEAFETHQHILYTSLRFCTCSQQQHIAQSGRIISPRFVFRSFTNMASAIDLSEYASSSTHEKIELLFKFFDVDEDGWLVGA